MLLPRFADYTVTRRLWQVTFLLPSLSACILRGSSCVRDVCVRGCASRIMRCIKYCQRCCYGRQTLVARGKAATYTLQRSVCGWQASRSRQSSSPVVTYTAVSERRGCVSYAAQVSLPTADPVASNIRSCRWLQPSRVQCHTVHDSAIQWNVSTGLLHSLSALAS